MTALLAAIVLGSWWLASLTPNLAHAEDTTSRGSLGMETRVFWPDAEKVRYPGNAALVGRLQVDAEWDVLDELSVRARIFTRSDIYDRARRLVVPEEAYVHAELGLVTLKLGYQLLSWTATEAFHPADIANSRIYTGSFDRPEKLGELMASLRLEIPFGNLTVYAMPLFTESIFPSPHSALNLYGPGVQPGTTQILDRTGTFTEHRWQAQWGVSIQQSWGTADLTLHLVQHIERQQLLVLFEPEGHRPLPVFQALTQFGGTYTHVLGSTILKLEGAYKVFNRPSEPMTAFGLVPKRDHVLLAAGIEQQLPLTNSADTALLLEAEALLPSQNGYPKHLEPLFQHDVLLGIRHQFNDTHSTSLSATAIVDVLTPKQVIAHLSLERRLGTLWLATAGMRLLFYPPEDKSRPLLWEHLNRQHHVYLNLARHF